METRMGLWAQERKVELVKDGKFYLASGIGVDTVIKMLREGSCLGAKYFAEVEVEIRGIKGNNPQT